MIKKGIALLLLILAVYWNFTTLSPTQVSNLDVPENQFSTERALVHLKEISKEKHFTGSEAHKSARNYIVDQLKSFGLDVEVQKGYAMGKGRELVKAKNILAKIEGSDSSKALMLLTHYDSEPHSSFGASDAGSGVVTILEGVRALLTENKQPKNDIIILFSDAEELDLNGANIFVNQHRWAKDVGLVLNFEARGSGGSSLMFMETNQGNANLLSGFIEANPEFPVTNSLFYSLYKILPNDTDLTRFRDDGDIDGFNFAFIDDHYDYHTALDTYDRLDRESLEHQAHYLMPLLNHFSEANLNNIKSEQDYIYFNAPLFKMIKYPFSWALPMLILSILLFILIVGYGFKRKVLQVKEVGKGVLAFLTTLIGCGALGFLGWKLIVFIYPHYSEILQGFPYNGHNYIAAFVCLSIAICMMVYHKFYANENTASLLIGPLFFWLLINIFITIKLIGASFFIIPVLFGLVGLFILIRQKQPNIIALTLLCFPLLAILTIFIKILPIGLGLKMMLASTCFVALIYSLLVPVFGFFRHKKRLGYVFFILGVCFLFLAHFNSDFTKDNPKPNSLVYLLDKDTNSALWLTYDEILDQWTRNILNENPDKLSGEKDSFKSKYHSRFSYSKNADVKPILEPKTEVTFDTIINNTRQLEVCITPQRKANRIEIVTDTSNVFNSLKVNGVEFPRDFSPKSTRLFTYYITDNEPLDLLLSVPKDQETKLQVFEASYDLLENEHFNIPTRDETMIPKPFVLNDAIIVKKTIVIK